MHKFILEQMLKQPVALTNREILDTYQFNNNLSDNKKLSRNERLIFLRILRNLKKNINEIIESN